ncbi:hypothetical protein, partial [Aliiruegeria lutimaris]
HWMAPFLAVDDNCTLARSMPVEQEPSTSSAFVSESVAACVKCSGIRSYRSAQEGDVGIELAQYPLNVWEYSDAATHSLLGYGNGSSELNSNRAAMPPSACITSRSR